MGKNKKKGGGKNLLKPRTFISIESVIEEIVMSRILSRTDSKRFDVINFTQTYAEKKGPFIQTEFAHKEKKVNWVQWADSNKEIFTKKINQNLEKNGFNYKHYLIKIKSENVSIQEIDLENIPHAEEDISHSQNEFSLSANS